MKLKEIAHTDLITINDSDSIDKAISLMEEHNVRHLPVLCGELPVGILSERDIMSAVGGLLSSDRIAETEGPAIIGPDRVASIMTKTVHSFSPDERVETAGRAMRNEKISAAPLIEDNRFVGIVTEKDFLNCYLDDRSIAPGSGWRFKKVFDHMSAHVHSLSPREPLVAGIVLMKEKRIRHLPVVDNGRLVGLVSDRDLRKAYFEQAMEQVHDLTAERRQRSGRVHLFALGDVMIEKIDSISSTATLAEAAHDMVAFRFGSLPVIDKGEFVGIITESDLLGVLITAFDQS